MAGFLDRFTNTKHTTISLPCIFTIRARAHNLDTLSHQSGTIRNKRKMIYLTECVSHNIVPFPLTLTTITPSYYLRPRIFRARLLPCTLGKRRLRSIRLLIFPNRTRSRSGCHLTWLSGGTGPFRTIRRLESEAAPALWFTRPSPRMGGMLDALFEWTGLTGTQLLTSVVGGVVLAVLARLVMTWYLTK